MTKYYHSSFLSGRFSILNPRNLFFFKLFFFALLPVLNSCEEDPTRIGKGILPGKDFVQVAIIDTLSTWSYTAFDEKFSTDSSSIVFLGSIFDPYFGISTSEFVSQIRFRPVWDHVPFTVDSAKLFMKFMTVTGTPGVNSIRISEITEQIYTDSSYFSTTEVKSDTLNGIVLTLPPLVTDSINYLVMTVPVEFAEKFVRDTSMLFYSNTKPDYRSSFKGLHFQLFSGTDPLIVSMYNDPPDLNNDLHNSYHNFFILFMHEADGTKKEMQFILDASNRNAYYSRITHNFDAADPLKKIAHINDGYRDTLSYLQYLNGVYTRLVFPGLEVLKNDTAINRMAVDQAKLTIPVIYDDIYHRPANSPQQLLLRYKTASGTKYVVPDYYFDEFDDNRRIDYYKGRLDSAIVDSKKEYFYTFNIAGFVQQYLDDETLGITPELEIFQRFNGLRSVILNGNGSTKPVKFEFIYTKF